MSSAGQEPNAEPQWRCRGIRGAISVKENTREAIIVATGELLHAMVEANHINLNDIASVFFTVTNDLNAEYPAVAARLSLGWHEIPLMCSQEMYIVGSLPRCIRVLIHWNTPLSNQQIQHIYLREAVALRPDITGYKTGQEHSLSKSETAQAVPVDTSSVS